jgi:hypothetical protein
LTGGGLAAGGAVMGEVLSVLGTQPHIARWLSKEEVGGGADGAWAWCLKQAAARNQAPHLEAWCLILCINLSRVTRLSQIAVDTSITGCFRIAGSSSVRTKAGMEVAVTVCAHGIAAPRSPLYT